MPLIHCHLGAMTWLESEALAGFLHLAAREPGWEVAVDAWNEVPARGTRPDIVLRRGNRSPRTGRLGTVVLGLNDGLPSVWTDDREIGRIAARHLLRLGFHHLAYRGDPGIAVSRWRCEGFTESARSAGASVIDLPPGRQLATAWSLAAEGRDTAMALARCPRPLGLLAFTGHVARRVLRCVDHGAAPSDMAVVAGDLDPLVRDACRPRLAGVDIGARRMGEAAADLVSGLIAGRVHGTPGIRVSPVGMVEGPSAAPAPVDPAVAGALRLIHAGETSVAALAAAAGIARRTLELRFASALGEGPAARIRRHRLDRALALLAERDDPVAAVALAAGWRSAPAFSRDVRAATGLAPQAWRLAARRR